MADMAKKPLENLYLNGDGIATKKELRAALGNAHISGVNPETNAILEVFQVDEINTDSVPENVRGRFIYSQNDAAEQRLFLPANSNIIQYPLVGELWLGFSYKGQHFYLSRIRASEFNMPLIRVSNNGISAVIDNYGKIIDFIPLNEKLIKKIELSFIQKPSNLTNYHFLLYPFLIVILLFALLLNKKQNEEMERAQGQSNIGDDNKILGPAINPSSTFNY